MKLVLLRGLAREAGHWLDFPQQLQQHLSSIDGLPTIDIITPDILGCGQFYRSTAARDIASSTDHIRQHIALASNEKVIVVGLSMGGMLALDWLLRYPSDIAGVVLINSSLGNQPVTWRLQMSAWGLVVKSFFLSTEAREKRILREVSNDHRHYASNEQRWLAIQKQRPVTLPNILRMLLSAKTFHLDGFPIQTPGLILASQLDRLVSVKCSQDIANRSQWPLVIHPWAGHDLPLDDPLWVCGKISSWLQSM
ncbi:2-succinyl-6-hydroxy-2, 4-cyclohexadiene-1-carboxylate synthase [Thalassocella blandensis]|nr:2-succinyl-6-hydroxy-2, 4-cyclohexadiene-1-carboxylate synthase [Thalassocella blandensis]